MGGVKYKKQQSGFTIVELLIVIVVIGILAALVLNSFSDAQKKARDSRRLSDITAISKAIKAYGISTGQLQWATASPGIDWWEASTDAPGTFLESLSSAGYFRQVPVDPLNTPAYHYGYYLYSTSDAVWYGCDATRGRIVVVAVKDMETSAGAHPASPGFACSGRDWEDEFEWVTGFYENDLL